MNNLKNIIEQDDLESFKINFNVSQWQQAIAQIENYADLPTRDNKKHLDNCDALKYSVHTNADKIFNYLLPLVDHPNKHSDNYGWPILAMALKNNRYDYAQSIIEHPSFNLYAIYHINTFSHIGSRENIAKHIDFLFNYLDKFDSNDFYDSHCLYSFINLICHDENSFEKFKKKYQQKINKSDVSVFNLFENNWKLLATEVFFNKFNPFILDKLNDNEFYKLMLSAMDDNIIFSNVFHSEQAQTCLNYLIKTPDLLQKNVYNNPVMFSYLPLTCLIFLINNNIDLFTTSEEQKFSVIDFILLDDDLNEEKTSYFINNHTQKTYDHYNQIESSNKRSNNIKIYCNKILLSQELETKHTCIQNKKRKL